MSIMMPRENNKAGWQPLPNKFYEISVTDIQKYLQDEILGFKVATSWKRWTGVTAFASYLRMRVVISPKDIEVGNTRNDYVDRFLAEYSAERNLNKNVMDALKPFMYPENMRQIYMSQNYEKKKHLNDLGVIGQNLDELVKWSQINYVRDQSTDRGYYRIYLAPEKIIFDGLTNAETGKIDGTLYIRRIYGTKTEQFRVLVERVLTDNTVTDDLSVDQIYAM